MLQVQVYSLPWPWSRSVLDFVTVTYENSRLIRSASQSRQYTMNLRYLSVYCDVVWYLRSSHGYIPSDHERARNQTSVKDILNSSKIYHKVRPSYLSLFVRIEIPRAYRYNIPFSLHTPATSWQESRSIIVSGNEPTTSGIWTPYWTHSLSSTDRLHSPQYNNWEEATFFHDKRTNHSPIKLCQAWLPSSRWVLLFIHWL